MTPLDAPAMGAADALSARLAARRVDATVFIIGYLVLKNFLGRFLLDELE